MVSVGVSRMGKTSVVFVEPGAKLNSQYYCEKVLGQGLLPDIRTRCGRYKWTLQQDGATVKQCKSATDDDRTGGFIADQPTSRGSQCLGMCVSLQ